MLAHAKNLYTNGTRVCPSSVPVRIDFAYFLLTKLHNKRDALKELILCEKMNLTLDESFKIFR